MSSLAFKKKEDLGPQGSCPFSYHFLSMSGPAFMKKKALGLEGIFHFSCLCFSRVDFDLICHDFSSSLSAHGQLQQEAL